MANDIYVGNGREKVFDNGGSVINIGVCLDSIEEIPEEFIKTSGSGKRYVNFVIGARKNGEEDEWGNTHWVKLDQFIPNRDGTPKKRFGKKASKKVAKKAVRKRAF